MNTYKITERVRTFMNTHNMTAGSDNLIIGLSGGADSVCLLYIINRLKRTAPEFASLNLYAVHVNHGIRGEEARRDEEFSRLFCEKLGITFIAKQINIPQLALEMKMGTEQCARIERYKIFREEAAHAGKALIATAHHKNDLAETAIFNIARGTGLKGASGISPVNGDVIRPLLCLTRKEIEEFNIEEGLEYVTDSTNADSEYKRNHIRNNIVPLLEEVNTEFIEHMASFCEIAGRAYDYLDMQAEKLFRECKITDSNYVSVPKEIIRDNEDLILELLYKKIIAYLKGDCLDISSNRLNEIKKCSGYLKESGTPGISGEKKIIEITKDIKVQTLKNGIIFFKGELETREKNGALIRAPIYILNDENRKKLEAGETVIIDENEFSVELKLTENFIKNSNADYTKYFDYDKIKFNVYLKNREPGDVLTINKKGDRHSLKQELIDKKVPKEDRDRLILLADDSEILWIAGVRAGCKAMADPECDNKRVLRVTLKWK